MVGLLRRHHSTLHLFPFPPLPPFFFFFLLVCPSAGVAGEGDRIIHSFGFTIQFQSHGTSLLIQQLSAWRVLGLPQPYYGKCETVLNGILHRKY